MRKRANEIERKIKKPMEAIKKLFARHTRNAHDIALFCMVFDPVSIIRSIDEPEFTARHISVFFGNARTLNTAEKQVFMDTVRSKMIHTSTQTSNFLRRDLWGLT